MDALLLPQLLHESERAAIAAALRAIQSGGGGASATVLQLHQATAGTRCREFSPTRCAAGMTERRRCRTAVPRRPATWPATLPDSCGAQ